MTLNQHILISYLFVQSSVKYNILKKQINEKETSDGSAIKENKHTEGQEVRCRVGAGRGDHERSLSNMASVTFRQKK